MTRAYPETPDGRYFVAKERSLRKTDLCLCEEDRKATGPAVGQAGGRHARGLRRGAGGERPPGLRRTVRFSTVTG